MSTHTPGPWTFDIGIKGYHVFDADYITVCTLRTKDTARLIAAAPELLKELKWIAGRIDRNSGSPNFTSDEHDRILAVIAKAEGTP